MYIQRIELKNYRGHEHLVVPFQRGMSVIAGINGTGKTSLLLGLFEALTHAVPALPDASSLAFTEAGCARVKVISPHGRSRFEEQYPIQVKVDAEVLGSRTSWEVVSSLPGVKRCEGTPPARPLWDQMVASTFGFEGAPLSTAPVIAFYRDARAWRSGPIKEVDAAMERNSRIDGYEAWADAGLSASALQRWVVAKSLERLQAVSQSVQAVSTFEGDELGQINRALRSVLAAFQSIHFDIQSKKILSEWLRDDHAPNDLISFEHLSAGQRAVICLVADIARRMCLLNPHLGDDVIGQTAGIVLIDEIDMHLHPEWQRALTRGLTKAFPKVQFIVASHSPQVIGELPHDHVILLTPEGPVNPPGSFGMTSNQVLQELMSAEVRATPVKASLDEIDEALTRNQLDVAEQKIDELSKTAPELRELIGKEALLQRKRTLGR
ncbi:AAA family ATPase [Roseateles sp. L2-2]|uniref:AAA family ATPase n=1 Tax=Roseateles sp. L2-2 TaxID=3422597 RepID=UPI003D35D2A4